jgi:hypothetical protein
MLNVSLTSPIAQRIANTIAITDTMPIIGGHSKQTIIKSNISIMPHSIITNNFKCNF